MHFVYKRLWAVLCGCKTPWHWGRTRPEGDIEWGTEKRYLGPEGSKFREVGGKIVNLGPSRYELATKYYFGYHIKEAKLDGARAAHRENINMYRILVGKLEGKRPNGRPRRIKLRGLSPHANYTDRAAAAGRRS